jgi:hypothetical protein
VVGIKLALRGLEIDARLGLLLPRHLSQPVEVVAHHGGLGRHRRHHLQLVEFGLCFGLGGLGHAGLLDLARQFFLLVRHILELAQFLLDGFHLLIEVVLALILLHLRFHAPADLLLDLQDVDLAFQLRQHVLQARPRLRDFQHLLLVFELEVQMRGNGVGQTSRRVHAGQRRQQLGRHLLVELDVLLEGRDRGAHHRIDLAAGLRLIGGQRLEVGGEERLIVPEPYQARALRALDQHLHRAVGQLQQLQDAGQRAGFIEIIDARLVGIGMLLRHQQDALAVLHRGRQRAHRLLAAHEQRNRHVGIDHDITERQDGRGVIAGSGHRNLSTGAAWVLCSTRE